MAGSLLAMAVSGVARADGLSGYAELSYSEGERTVESDAGREESEFRSFLQRYGLDWSRRLFPQLTLKLGSTFEKIESRDLTSDSQSATRRIFPYARLTSSTRTFFTVLGYDKILDRARSDGFISERFQDNYRATVAWRSRGLPGVRLQWLRSDLYDPDRLSQNTTFDTKSLYANWKPIEPLQLNYRGSVRETDDKIARIESRAVTHLASVGYWERWRGGRIAFGGEYTFVNSRSKSTAETGVESSVPVLPFQGLSFITDNPLDGALVVNSALIDRDRDTGAGVDIGVPEGGEDPRPRNVGLDFGSAAPVNRLLVWVDRRLTDEVARSFFWGVYVSQDNQFWTLVQTVPSAPFDAFENFFRLDIGTVNARYVKLVVAPLSAAVPGADQFPSIQVTELDAELRTISDGTTQSVGRNSHQVSSNLRVRILESVPLTYEFSAFGTKVEGRDATGNMSNALAISHAFNPVYFGSARLARTDRWEAAGSTVDHALNASLTATPLPTLRHSLIFGATDRNGVDDRNEASVTWNGTAAIYRGIDLNAYARRSGTNSDTQGSFAATGYGAGMRVTPHPTVNFNLTFRNEDTESRGGVPVPFERVTRSKEISANWRPVESLFLAFATSWLQPDVGPERRLTSAYVAWSPPVQGALVFSASYSEIYRSEIDGVESNLSGTVRWNITQRMYADVTYVAQDIENGRLGTRTRNSTLFASWRVSF